MRDPGLQPERTALAWRRTAFALMVNGCLLVRTAFERHSTFVAAASGLVLVAAFGLLAIASARHAALLRDPRHSAPHALVVALVCGVVLLACAAALIGAFG